MDARSLVEEYERQHPGWTLRVRYCGHFEGAEFKSILARPEGSDATDICYQCAQADELRRVQHMAADRV